MIAGASIRASFDLPGAGKPAGDNEFRSRRYDGPHGKIEIGSSRRCDRFPLAIFEPLHPRRGDLGADRRARGQEKRHGRERIEILDPARFPKVAVEYDIGGGREPALKQVHEQESEVVENVA